ncbi:MAG TPA: hypothetical protein VJN96_02355 [Vicinamibacterales bacterium]|nr:hypothetical protein [Vicinamibacterales bacterium]
MLPSPFSAGQIESLFGHEAAEDEAPSRLRAYYFKTDVYDQVTADVPLRIVVGHKGVGKSALFKIAISEGLEGENLPILIRPDDVAALGADAADFLKAIREWKEGLLAIIAKRVLTTLGSDESAATRFIGFGGKLIDFLQDTFRNRLDVNLKPTNAVVRDTFLKSRRLDIYIDDLDRGWEGRPQDVRRISALLNAIRDIANDNPGISFKISLRSDVYFLVRTSDESTDKIEGSVIWHKWTNHQILVLLVKRIETFFGRTVDEHSLMQLRQRELASYLSAVMEPRFTGEGLWANAPVHRVLMSLIRQRPRDLVKLLTLAARNAREAQSPLISTANFRNIFEEYSQGRVQDTINESRSELPDVQRLLLNMKPNRSERTAKAGYVYNTANLLKKIAGIMESGPFTFSRGERATSKQLAAFMYKINFLTARKETSAGIVRKYFEESRYLASDFVDFGFDWEIHPAYRWALQPDRPEDIYHRIQLSTDD